MGVRPEFFNAVAGADAMQIFAIIVDLYGRKMADEIAAEVARGSRPVVNWPRF